MDHWPALPLEEWQDTYATLHRWLQMVGKTRLALAPMQNHWWQVTLYLTARGMTTSPIPYEDRSFEIEFDFFSHELIVRTSDGETRTVALAPRSVADFYQEYVSQLGALGIKPRIWPVPTEVPDTRPFNEDHEHAAYDRDAAQRCWRILAQTDRLLKLFRGSFLGKCSPSHFWWGGFDIACTRFSGRRAPTHPGGIPNIPDYVNREAYSHECISAGWWAGTPGGPVSEPAFYAYAYPEPPGYPDARVEPAEASYHPQMRIWILPYDAVRTAPDPDTPVLSFLENTYAAAATLGKWNRAELERPRA